MTEWETEGQGGATEGLDDDEPGDGTDGGSGDGDEGTDWDETNDEPAQGEQGQNAV
jgi:hypothetical protein